MLSGCLTKCCLGVHTRYLSPYVCTSLQKYSSKSWYTGNPSVANAVKYTMYVLRVLLPFCTFRDTLNSCVNTGTAVPCISCQTQHQELRCICDALREQTIASRFTHVSKTHEDYVSVVFIMQQVYYPCASDKYTFLLRDNCILFFHLRQV